MKILIRGTRNNSHSGGIVNQFQLLAFLARNDGNELFHEDLPLGFTYSNPGFREVDAGKIAAVPNPPADAEFDLIYTHGSAYTSEFARAGATHVACLVTETGHNVDRFKDEAAHLMAHGGQLITPSCWSRARFAEGFGISEDAIVVVPHGVDTRYFYPLPEPVIEQNRQLLQCGGEDFVFLNLSAMTSNKGIDALLAAFEVVATRYPKVKLILKDASHIYNVSAQQVIAQVLEHGLLRHETLKRITVLSGCMDFSQILCLYNSADCYVSPYRAEGFNLPVLESLACHRPVIVTQGGATDDFTHGTVAGFVKSYLYADDGITYLQPSRSSLIHEMCVAVERGRRREPAFHDACEQIRGEYGWDIACSTILGLRNRKAI